MKIVLDTDETDILLEEQNKKRLFMARQEYEATVEFDDVTSYINKVKVSSISSEPRPGVVINISAESLRLTTGNLQTILGDLANPPTRIKAYP